MDTYICVCVRVYVCVGVSLQEITTTRVETVQFAKVHTCTPSTLDEGFVATIVTTSNIKSCLGIAQAKRDDAAMLFLFILSPSFFGISETTSMAGVKRPGPARLAPEVNRVLYIRNLPFKISADEMYDIFGKFGAIRQIRLGNAPNTRGTAFVVYEDILDAKNALEHLSGFNVAGRYLIVLYHQPEKMKKNEENKV